MNHSLTIRPDWTPVTIGLMVLGFLVAWPLGLLMLAYILWGDRIPEFRRKSEEFRHRAGFGPQAPVYNSGNVAFDEYRERELKRLDEERRRLDEERHEFETYVRNLRRAKDQEEFDRFRSERRSGGHGDEATAL